MNDLAYLAKMASTEQADAPAFMALIEAYRAAVTPRPISEYHEDMGSVLWWCWETKPPLLRERSLDEGDKDYGRWLGEPPYVGSPNCLGQTVEAHVRLLTQSNQEQAPTICRIMAGGWPGYHTHFTMIPMPTKPEDKS